MPRAGETVTGGKGGNDAYAALAEKQPPQDALEFACAVGALTTAKLGTQTASPTRDGGRRPAGALMCKARRAVTLYR